MIENDLLLPSFDPIQVKTNVKNIEAMKKVIEAELEEWIKLNKETKQKKSILLKLSKRRKYLNRVERKRVKNERKRKQCNVKALGIKKTRPKKDSEKIKEECGLYPKRIIMKTFCVFVSMIG